MLTPYFALDQGSLPPVDYGRYLATKSSADVARKVAEESITLLKNTKKAGLGLPLCKPRDLIRVLPTLSPSVIWLTRSAPPHLRSCRIGRHSRTPRYPNNNPAEAAMPHSDFTGFISDGFGSGGSPQPYSKDPLSAFTARGQQEERPVIVDGYFSECVVFILSRRSSS